MVNDFGSLLVKLTPHEHFDIALDSIARIFHGLKGSLDPFGVVMATRLTVMTPFNIPMFLMNDITNKYTLVFSNLQASKKPYVYDGKKVLAHYCIAPGVAKLYTCVGFCSVDTKLSVTVFSDQAMMENPQLLCDIMARKNAELLGLPTK